MLRWSTLQFSSANFHSYRKASAGTVWLARYAGTQHAIAVVPSVRAATAATRALAATPELAVSSTDANIPMSLGIPAITMGAGGEAGQAHTTEEWYRNVQGPEGILRALLTMLLLENE